MTDRFDSVNEDVISFLGKGLVVAVSILTAVLFARFLGPAKLGEYFFSLAIGLLLSNIFAGFGKATKKHIETQNLTTKEGYFTISLLGLAGLSLPVLGLAFIVSFLLSTSLPFLTTTHILAICGVAITVGVFEVVEDLHKSFNGEKAGVFTTPLRNLSILGVQIGLILLNFSVPFLIIGFSAVTALTTVLLILYSGFRLTKPNMALLKKIAVDSTLTTPVMLLGNLFGRIDIFIIGIAATTTAVGYYEASYRVLLPALLVSASASRNLTTKTHLLSDGNKIRNELEKAVRLTGFLAIPVFFISIAIPNELLRLVLGPAFIENAMVWPYIVGLAFVIVLTAYREPFNATIRGLNRPKLILLIQALFLAINIPLSFALVSVLGGVGAVIGTIIIEFGLLLTYELLAYKYLGGFVFPDLAIEQLLSGFVLVMFLKPFALIYPVGQPVFFTIAIIGSTVTYIVTLSIISQEFRYHLQRLKK